MTIAAVLLLLSSTIIFLLGTVHSVITFRSNRLWPRDESLKAKMESDSPRISKETTIWRAWIGFNASHSMGSLLFGFTWGYFSLVAPEVFFQSVPLQVAGGLYLIGFCTLGWNYWFSVPFRGALVSAVLYSIGLIAWYA